MSKDSLVRFDKKKKNKEKFKKKSLVKDIKIFLKKKKTENDNMVENDIKISQKLKKRLLDYGKISYEMLKNKNLL